MFEMFKLHLALLIMSSSLLGEQVVVENILGLDSILIREYPDYIDQKEMGFYNLNKEDLRSGSFRLSGIKLEHHDNKMGIFASEIGKEAAGFILGMTNLNKYKIIMDDGQSKDTYGNGIGYLIDKKGRVLNIELIRNGYSPYYFKDGLSKLFHTEMVQAERTAFHGYKGIWSNLERREYYYKDRQRWAKALDIRAPGLYKEGEWVEDVGEDPKSKDVMIGMLIVLFIIAAGANMGRVERIRNGFYHGYLARKIFSKVPILGFMLRTEERIVTSVLAKKSDQSKSPEGSLESEHQRV